MNTPNDPLEEELRGLAPATPSLRLTSRIATDLADATPPAARATRRPILRDVSLWLSWGVAAVMTVAYFTRTPPPATTTTAGPDSSEVQPAETAAAGLPAGFKPVSTTNTLVGASDEGIVLLESGQLARKVRYEFLDTIDLRSTDDTAAMIAVTTPREEIRLVPVQTF